MARSLDERQQAWRSALPKESSELWGALETFDADSRDALFAHCVSLSVNAVHEAWNRRPKAFIHADRLAQAVDLDMAANWTPTAANFLGRVTKARIQQAVAEARGQRAAERIEHLKKVEMATEAEALLAGSGWLPEPLRTPGRVMTTTVGARRNRERWPQPEAVIEETATDERRIGRGRRRRLRSKMRKSPSLRRKRRSRTSNESSLADEQAIDDQEITFEPHTIAAE